MAYRDVPSSNDYRDRPSPIYAPFLPRTSAVIQPPNQTNPKQLAALQKLSEAISRVVDPSGANEPLQMRLSSQKGFFAEVMLPSPLPQAPLSFVVRLTEDAEPTRTELRSVGLNLRNGWADYFLLLEKNRFLYRQELLANDSYQQELLQSGLPVPCPRCGDHTYKRSKQEKMKLRDLPVPLLRTREVCSHCHLARLFEEIRCRRCPGLVLPSHRSYAALYDSSDAELPIRETQRWRCQLCHDEILSTSLLPPIEEP
jgi:hypothetical protein